MLFRSTLGKKYILTDYGVINDSTLLQTEKIQSAIDAAAQNGGGVIVIPKGTYLSGALFFKPKTHLHLEEGAVLKGSDDISNFPIIDTRMEGQSLKYFAAFVYAPINRIRTISEPLIEKWEYDTPFPALANLTSLRLHVDILDGDNSFL